jgi:hydrogenase maturation protein HypF
MLVGERPIARRVDDSVVRVGALGPMVLRRSRGLAPGAVVTLPTTVPILALGGDLKNAVTIVVDGQAYVSQHIGDLSHLAARRAFQDTIQDLLAMYAIRPDEITIVHDQHPEYASSALAPEVGARMIVAVQHHRAHVASVLAEREAMDRRVLGVALDGTGYGDDGTVWGGEFFVGSVADGFTRIGHLRQARLAGGDAAAQFPVQAAAGFLAEVDDLGDLAKVPFRFPARYQEAAALIEKDVRVFRTTSMGRLFDAVAALVGFTRPITYEGQAAIWLEHLARREWSATETFACPFVNGEVDWREALADIVDARRWGGPPDVIARGFHRGLARGIADAVMVLAEQAAVDTVVFSGGVMQNQLLLEDLVACLAPTRLQLWLNRAVPPNDGGLSLGQAALAACGVCDAV